ncbi:MAG: YncE family protein [Candidatus Dormibacteria bacterium]
MAGHTTLVAGTGRLWVSVPHRHLVVSIDPTTAAQTPIPTPASPSVLAASPRGVVGVRWTSGVITEIRTDGSVHEIEVGRSLTRIAHDGTRIWVYDLADDQLIVLGDDLRVLQRIQMPMEVARLIPVAGDCLALAPGRAVRVSPDGSWRDLPDLARHLLGEVEVGESGIWVARFEHDPWSKQPNPQTMSLTDPRMNPRSSVTCYDQANGAVAVRLEVVGQVHHLLEWKGVLWFTGFVRSRQRSLLQQVNITSGTVTAVADLSHIDVAKWLPPPPPRRPRASAEVHDQLVVQEIRTRLSQSPPPASWDHRTGAPLPGPPHIHPDFHFVDASLVGELSARVLLIQFRWSGDDAPVHEARVHLATLHEDAHEDADDEDLCPSFILQEMEEDLTGGPSTRLGDSEPAVVPTWIRYR